MDELRESHRQYCWTTTCKVGLRAFTGQKDACNSTSGVELKMDIITWLVVGLVAGLLASLVMGGTGYGLVGDIIIGILGAFVGGWLMRVLGTSMPVGGLAGIILVAFIGAVVLLFVLRVIRRTTKRAP